MNSLNPQLFYRIRWYSDFAKLQLHQRFCLTRILENFRLDQGSCLTRILGIAFTPTMTASSTLGGSYAATPLRDGYAALDSFVVSDIFFDRQTIFLTARQIMKRRRVWQWELFFVAPDNFENGGPQMGFWVGTLWKIWFPRQISKISRQFFDRQTILETHLILWVFLWDMSQIQRPDNFGFWSDNFFVCFCP